MQLVNQLGDGLLAVDPMGGLSVVNPAAERLLGLAEGRRPDWFTQLGACGADRETPLVASEFPPFAAARLGVPVEGEVWVRNDRVPGGRVLLVSAWPLPAEPGGSPGAVATVRPTRPTPGKAEPVRKDAYVELLSRVAAAANDAASVDEALAVALGAVCRASGWSVGQALLLCDMPPRFVLHAPCHLADPARQGVFRLATEQTPFGTTEGLPGRVRATARPVFLRDIATDPAFVRAASARAAGLDVAFAFPILVREEVVGVLEFFAGERPPPDDVLIDVVVQVGALLGRVVERERAKSREAFFRAVIDHVGDPIFVKDRAFRWVVLNRAFGALSGFSPADMIGKSDPDFFPKEQADFFRGKDVEMFGSESTVIVEEEPITDASGEVHWLATTKVPLRGVSGDVTHLVGIIHDISRLKRAEDDLRQRNEQLAAEVRQHAAAEASLRAANRELEGFCHSVSHDLRAPLRAIDGFSSLLQREHAERLDATGRHCLDRVRTNAQRMAQLIDDLLQLSRVSRTPLHRETFDLAALAEEVMDELRREEPLRRVRFDVGSALEVSADPRLTRLLLENLLGNAWKFTSRRADAHISLTRTGATFCVRDDGAGFEMAYVDTLFRPFSRLHRDDEFPGTGVGLATVRRIVERHGGRVHAEGSVDLGASLFFTLAGE